MSLPEIDYNKLRADGLEYASDQLREAAELLAAELDLREGPEEVIRKHPTQVFAMALIAHLDERAEERRLMKEAEIELLREISDNHLILVESVAQLISGQLKEIWLKAHPNATPAEMAAAMRYFDSMAIKNSRLGHADE